MSEEAGGSEGGGGAASICTDPYGKELEILRIPLTTSKNRTGGPIQAQLGHG